MNFVEICVTYMPKNTPVKVIDFTSYLSRKYMWQSQVEIEDYSVKVKIEVNADIHSSTALST